jgi:predicted TIM-barrel fold metal-dependent hydrolase
MHIDVHAHYFPQDYLDLMTRFGAQSPRSVPMAPGAQVTLSERLELMDDAGIDMQVLSVAAVQPYLDEAANAVEAARAANDLYVDVCKQHRGRFAAFGTVPLPHVDAALAEVERCLDRLGMLGITTGCSVAGRTLDSPEFAPFWEELNRRRAVLFLHPVGAGAGPGTADYGLTWMIGAPFEDTIVALRIVLSGVVARYPDVRIIVPHLGGTIPFLFQRIDDQNERRLDTATGELPEPATAYLKRLWYDTVNRYPAALRCSCDAFGAERILLGTDWPYLAGPKFKHCVTYVQEAGLSERETEGILGNNAAALLGLDQKASTGG